MYSNARHLIAIRFDDRIIFSPEIRNKDAMQRNANEKGGRELIDQKQTLASCAKTRGQGHDHSRYDGILLARPREKAVATNGVKCVRVRGSRPRRRVRESIRGKQIYTKRKLEAYDLFEDE